MRKRHHLGWFALAALLMLGSPAAPAGALPPEQQVKAEFMERFTRFIDWPKTAFARDADPFVFCLAGKHPFADYIDKMAKARAMKGRKVVVVNLTETARAPGCHLLFIAGSEVKRLPELLKLTATRPVLTVSDTDRFAELGVLINFYRDGDNVRFQINIAAVARSGLRFSAKLLRLAKIVGGKP